MTASKRPSFRQRFRLRPGDIRILDWLVRSLSLTASGVVRITLAFAHQAWKMQAFGTPVVRNEQRQEEESLDLSPVGAAPANEPAPEEHLTASGHLEVPLRAEDRGRLRELVRIGYGSHMTGVVRRALESYEWVLRHLHGGSQFGVRKPDGEFVLYSVPGTQYGTELIKAAEPAPPGARTTAETEGLPAVGATGQDRAGPRASALLPDPGQPTFQGIAPASTDDLGGYGPRTPTATDAVERFRERHVNWVRTYAERALYDLNARTVESFCARAGWVFVYDGVRQALVSLDRAAFNTERCRLELPVHGQSFVTRVFKTREGDFSNDVTKVPDYRPEIESTQSELAVPLSRPDGTVFGVYNLEADQKGAFTPAQVRELQKKVVSFVPHLLVLENLKDKDLPEAVPWHPDLHGFDPQALATEFCRAVAERYAVPGKPPPSCMVWNVDIRKRKCWALGGTGFDYEFLTTDTLRLKSAVAGVALDPGRKVRRGTPQQLRFERLEKAERMNVRYAILAPLGRPADEQVCGTLNLYFFEDRPAGDLPSDAEMSELAVAAERLVRGVHNQRRRLALAYLRRQLAEDTSFLHEFHSYLRVALRFLGAQAGSVYAREGDMLQCVETTGLEGVPDPTQVRYHRARNKESYTCWLANHPGHVLRLNWGPVEESESEDRPKDLPSRPSNHSLERMDPDGSFHRRFLGVGVQQGYGAASDLLGVIRILRTATAKPFTRADEDLLATLADAAKPLFNNWSFAVMDKTMPNQFSPTLTRLQEVLKGSVDGCLANDFPILQATLFVRSEGATRQYRPYAYYSLERMLPPDGLAMEDADAREIWNHDGKIVVLEFKEPTRETGLRICVPLQVWSGPHLVEAIFALDFRGTGHSWNNERKLKVFRDARKLTAIWAMNHMRANRYYLEGDDHEIIDSFLEYLAEDAKIRWARLRLSDEGDLKDFKSYGEAPKKSPGLNMIRLDRDLMRFGVALSADSSCCLIPLMLGPFQAAEIECGLAHDLTSDLAGLAPLLSGSCPPENVGPRKRAAETFYRLRTLVATVAGTWCRLVADNLSWWDVVFDDDRKEGRATLWEERIRVRPCTRAPARWGARGAGGRPPLYDRTSFPTQPID